MIYSGIHNRKNKHICRKNHGVFIINDIIHFYESKDSPGPVSYTPCIIFIKRYTYIFPIFRTFYYWKWICHT